MVSTWIGDHLSVKVGLLLTTLLKVRFVGNHKQRRNEYKHKWHSPILCALNHNTVLMRPVCQTDEMCFRHLCWLG